MLGQVIGALPVIVDQNEIIVVCADFFGVKLSWSHLHLVLNLLFESFFASALPKHPNLCFFWKVEILY